MVKKFRRYLYSFWCNSGTWQTDIRTPGDSKDRAYAYASRGNDERDRSGKVPLSWGSPKGKRNLWWEWFVEMVGFEPIEWKSDEWREWGWWQRWVDKWMRRWIETRMVRLTEWIWKLIPKTRWCISKWAICNFYGGDGWRARESDNSLTDEERVLRL